MRWFFAGLLTLLAAVSVALLLRDDPGYVLISHGTWSVETSLALFTVLALIALLALYYALRLIVNAWRLPDRVRRWRARRRARRARRALTRGLMQLAEGHWAAAEGTLMRYVPDSETPLLNYLAAARAAQQQGAHERRDQYLRQAHESTPAADVAVGLSQAEHQIAHAQHEQALATLTRLRRLAPRHDYVLKRLMDVYRALKDWASLRDLLPELRRHRVAPEEELDELERTIHRELLAQAAAGRELAPLRAAWHDVPRALRQDETLTADYARWLLALGADAEAEPVIRAALKRRWSDTLAELYGVVQGPEPDRQLEQAEGWLKEHPHNAALLLTAGRLARRHDLWGKARGYLEASLGTAPRVVTYRELGALLEGVGERDRALECYRKGVMLASGEVPAEEGESSGETPTPPVRAVAE